jgi:hypothetical protein
VLVRVWFFNLSISGSTPEISTNFSDQHTELCLTSFKGVMSLYDFPCNTHYTETHHTLSHLHKYNLFLICHIKNKGVKNSKTLRQRKAMSSSKSQKFKEVSSLVDKNVSR